MADYVYGTEGRAQGFRLGNHIYDLDGAPVGKVFAEKVYDLSGAYVGLIVNNMVLDKPGVSRRSMPPARRPEPIIPPRGAATRRPVCEAYADCFDRLLPAAPEAHRVSELAER